MANSESPKASATPRKPIFSPASTALPQPPKTSTKVPTASARYRFMASAPPSRRAPGAALFAAPKGALHFFERREIFLESVHMLLHLHYGRPEFLHRAECPSHLRYLRLGRSLTPRPTHKPEREHRAEQTDEHPAPYILLL